MGKAQIRVRTRGRGDRRGFLDMGPFRWPCALGSGGVSARKREGDGATPRGVFRLVKAYYRPDQFRKLASAVPLIPMSRNSGWCDAPTDGNYNRPVRLPYPARAECLWREDRLYDVVIVLNYNLLPRVRGRGSAIFLHIARPGLTPTEGCVAIGAREMRLLLQHARKGCKISIL